MVACLILAGVVLTRAVLIQVLRNSQLDSIARRQFQAKVLLRPRRGTIMDRNGEPLAVNLDTNSLAANPLHIKQKRSLAHLLAKAAEIPYSKVLEKLSEKKEFVWIKRHISDAELNRFKKWQIIGADGDLVNGLWLVKENLRTYPHHELAGHLLGSVNVDSEGIEGTELWLNDRLTGKVVAVSAIKDALGRPTFIDALAAKDMKDGEPVSLTIDASLQFAVEQELRNSVLRTGARAGSAIVMNAETGEILAMANDPSFNPNHKGGPSESRRNRTFTDGFEPGSIMKPVLIATALLKGMKMTDQVWGERGHWMLSGKKISEVRYPGDAPEPSEAEAREKFEWINLKDILKHSSNIGAAKVALRVGADPYFSMLHAFGFGAKTETGFPGEISGQVPARKKWRPLTLANIGFGQGILVTQIQMIRAYAAFLNGGWLVQPTLLKDSAEAAGHLKRVPPRKILTRRICDEVTAALETVTEDGGTGAKAQLEGYRVAGKTGTAQAIDPATGTYSRNRHISSFIGYAVGVDPKLVILTSLDDPKGWLYFASDTAAPLFRNVLQIVANRFSLPTLPELQPPQPVLTDAKQMDKLRMPAAHPEPVALQQDAELHWEGKSPDGTLLWQMPGLGGLTPREAFRALQGHRFQVEVHGVGVVRSQIPPEGKVIADGGLIRLNLSEP